MNKKRLFVVSESGGREYIVVANNVAEAGMLASRQDAGLVEKIESVTPVRDHEYVTLCTFIRDGELVQDERLPDAFKCGDFLFRSATAAQWVGASDGSEVIWQPHALYKIRNRADIEALLDQNEFRGLEILTRISYQDAPIFCKATRLED